MLGSLHLVLQKKDLLAKKKWRGIWNILKINEMSVYPLVWCHLIILSFRILAQRLLLKVSL
jgi:hypothetical protein